MGQDKGSCLLLKFALYTAFKETDESDLEMHELGKGKLIFGHLRCNVRDLTSSFSTVIDAGMLSPVVFEWIRYVAFKRHSITKSATSL